MKDFRAHFLVGNIPVIFLSDYTSDQASDRLIKKRHLATQEFPDNPHFFTDPPGQTCRFISNNHRFVEIPSLLNRHHKKSVNQVTFFL
jgi:hypothetical protein